MSCNLDLGDAWFGLDVTQFCMYLFILYHSNLGRAAQARLGCVSTSSLLDIRSLAYFFPRAVSSLSAKVDSEHYILTVYWHHTKQHYNSFNVYTCRVCHRQTKIQHSDTELSQSDTISKVWQISSLFFPFITRSGWRRGLREQQSADLLIARSTRLLWMCILTV